MTKFKGYLDRLRENVEALDEAIATARTMSKKKGKDSNALQWVKTLRDLIELRNTTLGNIKTHLLGRDESGTGTEPQDFFDGNPEIEFERAFQRFLSPWTREDLKLKCQDCGVSIEEVSTRRIITRQDIIPDYVDLDLCPSCYAKRKAAEPPEPQDEEDDEEV